MFTLPDLPYDYSALEPYIDTETMKVHHDGHHRAYVNNLMASLDKVPEEIRTKIKNNGGGHINHSLFWHIMAPPTNQKPEGKLLEAFNSSFGNLASFQEKFTQAGLARFGS